MVVVLLVAVVAGALLVQSLGRGGPGSAEDSGGSTADVAASGPESGVALRDSGGGDADGDSDRKAVESSGANARAATAPLSRAVISTGQVTLSSKDLARARAEIMRLVASWGGLVADEQSTSDEKGRLADSTLTLRVPSSRFDDAMTAFDDLGDVEQRSRKSEDVTTRVVDNDARVRAAERSIRRIELLLSRATDLGDVISIENDLARRQADLDSLKSQQAYLQDQTSLSTINVYLSRVAGHPRKADEDRGFLAGLDGGWHALGGVTVVAMTVVGAVLPFGVLLALIGVPVWFVVRRRRVGLPSAGA